MHWPGLPLVRKGGYGLYALVRPAAGEEERLGLGGHWPGLPPMRKGG